MPGKWAVEGILDRDLDRIQGNPYMPEPLAQDPKSRLCRLRSRPRVSCLKLAILGVFTPWRSAKATSRGFFGELVVKS